MFKYAVDALTADPSGAVLAATPLMHMVPAAALLGYGAARATSSLCNELRNAVFAKARLTVSHKVLGKGVKTARHMAHEQRVPCLLAWAPSLALEHRQSVHQVCCQGACPFPLPLLPNGHRRSWVSGASTDLNWRSWVPSDLKAAPFYCLADSKSSCPAASEHHHENPSSCRWRKARCGVWRRMCLRICMRWTCGSIWRGRPAR